jgi:hypothetical protein
MPGKKVTSPFAARAVVPVRIVLSTGLLVQGSIFLSAEPNRFSDAWEETMRDPRGFLPITDAESRSAAEGPVEQTDTFLLIRKRDIVAVRPISES